MAQVFWRIPNTSGPDYDLGCYHGEKSGHVIIYSGTAILRIAFSVKDSSAYSFLLGESSYLLRLTVRSSHWTYTLESAESGSLIPPFENTSAKSSYPSDTIIFLLIILLMVLVFGGYVYFVT